MSLLSWKFFMAPPCLAVDRTIAALPRPGRCRLERPDPVGRLPGWPKLEIDARPRLLVRPQRPSVPAGFRLRPADDLGPAPPGDPAGGRARAGGGHRHRTQPALLRPRQGPDPGGHRSGAADAPARAPAQRARRPAGGPAPAHGGAAAA